MDKRESMDRFDLVQLVNKQSDEIKELKLALGQVFVLIEKHGLEKLFDLEDELQSELR